MKPCSRNRKQLAWLAVGALDAAKARDLRAHVQTCEACRRYLAELSTLTKNLAGMEVKSNVQTSESFHHRVVRRLRVKSSPFIWKTAMAQLSGRLPNWRIALPATAAVCLALLLLVKQPAIRSPKPPTTSIAPSALAAKPDLPPTFANYQMVANQSLEKFDELLSKQGNRNLPASRTYAASRMEE